MRTSNIGLLLAAAMTLTACGTAIEPPSIHEGDAPLIQITSEGGFAPVEMLLGRGPRYTLLADRRLIFEGPTIAIYPGPLLPNYQVTNISDEETGRILDLVDEVGLSDMDQELDDSAASTVADATTEVITYWDDAGEHTYAVYALGIVLDDSPSTATRAFAELFELMGDLTTGEAESYQPERVRVLAGPGFVNDEFEDVRDWPLDNESFSEWTVLPNGWMCTTYGPGVLDRFADATQATQWRWVPGDPTLGNAELFKLLVRALHPGEPDCPLN